MNNPLVSVIIPNYNHARFLYQRIQSVLNQTYQNFELIILDDKSSDNSREVIETYRKDPHVSHIVYNDENSGSTFKQWHKGFGLAKGDLIWIAESDDYCEVNLLEELVKEFCKYNNLVIAYSTLKIVNENGEQLNDNKIWRNQHYSGRHYIKHYLALANFIENASCAVFRKEALKNVRPNFMQYVGAGDYLFWVELAQQGSISIINKQLSCFRRHPGVVTDIRDADGTNMSADAEIYKYIKRKYHICWLRNRLVYAYHANRYSYVKFINPEIRDKTNMTWKIDNNKTIINRFLLRLFNIILREYNYFL